MRGGLRPAVPFRIRRRAARAAACGLSGAWIKINADVYSRSAIAQASGEVDQIFSGLTRNQAITAARGEAESRAVAAGATRDSLKMVELEDIPLSYLPRDARRVCVRIAGDIGPD